MLVMNRKSLHIANAGMSLRIKSQMALADLRQKDVAKKLGISEAAFSQKLSGSIRFSAQEISLLAVILSSSSDYLLGLKPLEVK